MGLKFSLGQAIILSIITLVPILVAVAYYTLAERKIMAAIQRRRGPNVVGVGGLLQPLADGLKAVLKEIIIPRKAHQQIFVAAPLLTLILSLSGWIVFPFNLADLVADINLAVLYLFAVSSLNVYGIIFAGGSSNSKYAFIGGLRSAAQMISYEVALGLILLPIVLLSGSLNLKDIVLSQEGVWFIGPLLPLAAVFFISSLAETNRAPFDLPEAEAELVAGYNVEYSSITFAMFFLGEYSNMLMMAALNTVFFLGGGLPLASFLSGIPPVLNFLIKMGAYSFLFVLVRASYPRYRYDQLMAIGGQYFLPLALGYSVLIAGVLVSFRDHGESALPVTVVAEADTLGTLLATLFNAYSANPNLFSAILVLLITLSMFMYGIFEERWTRMVTTNVKDARPESVLESFKLFFKRHEFFFLVHSRVEIIRITTSAAFLSDLHQGPMPGMMPFTFLWYAKNFYDCRAYGSYSLAINRAHAGGGKYYVELFLTERSLEIKYPSTKRIFKFCHCGLKYVLLVIIICAHAQKVTSEFDMIMLVVFDGMLGHYLLYLEFASTIYHPAFEYLKTNTKQKTLQESGHLATTHSYSITIMMPQLEHGGSSIHGSNRYT